jgi:hypothetical protein
MTKYAGVGTPAAEALRAEAKAKGIPVEECTKSDG